jgi:hypothetical protein
VHGRDSPLVLLAGVHAGVDPPAVGQREIEPGRQTVPLRQLGRTLVGVVDLDQQRAAELARPAQQLVVGVDLVLDVGLAHDPLDAHHLLDLVADGEPVLEEQREMLAEVHATRLLGREHLPAQRFAPVFVRRVVDDLVAADGSHAQSHRSPR